MKYVQWYNVGAVERCDIHKPIDMKMNIELYDALIAAGTGDEKARAAAASVVETDTVRLDRIEYELTELRKDVAELKTDSRVMKWMLGSVLALNVAIIVKLFTL